MNINGKTFLKYILAVVVISALLIIAILIDEHDGDNSVPPEQPDQPYLCDYRTICS